MKLYICPWCRPGDALIWALNRVLCYHCRDLLDAYCPACCCEACAEHRQEIFGDPAAYPDTGRPAARPSAN